MKQKKEKEQPSQRGGDASAETEESGSSGQDDDFWSQWQCTSVADVKRDTYGSARRRSMEKRLR